MLDVIGIDQSTQSVYEALIDRHPQTTADLAATGGYTLTEIRQAVRLLERLGLVSRLPGRPARYAAVAPGPALEVLFLERDRQVVRGRAYAERLAARFQQTAARDDPAELVEVITGVPAIRKRWEQLQRGLRRELRGIDKPPYTVQRGPIGQTEAERLRDGIRYRVIYDSAGLEQFHSWEADIEASIALGEQARVLAHAPTKLVLFDDRCAMIPLQPAPEDIASMIVVHPSGLLEALSALFEDSWRRALPIEAARTTVPATDSPTADEQRLLALLATGMPDRAIAQHLELSQRTYQRRLRSLFDRLGVESRFQAGLRAAGLGWY